MIGWAAAGAALLSATLPLAGKTVVIDPGHNGVNFSHPGAISRLVEAGGFRKACDTTGTATIDGYDEPAYTLDVSLRLAGVLRSEGARVELTRRTNDGVGPCIDERARIGNRARAAAAISIHADGGPTSGRGFHVIYRPGRPASLRLALALREAFDRTGLPRATYIGSMGLDARTDLGGLNLSIVPKVFVETGNMRNPTDARLLESARFRQVEARALARGLTSFLR